MATCPSCYAETSKVRRYEVLIGDGRVEHWFKIRLCSYCYKVLLDSVTGRCESVKLLDLTNTRGWVPVKDLPVKDRQLPMQDLPGA